MLRTRGNRRGGKEGPERTELVLTLCNAVDTADMALLPGIFRVL